MAFVSHLPQLTASALMDAVGERGTATRACAMAGRGLVDTTRLASSPADDLAATSAATNADAIERRTRSLIQRSHAAARRPADRGDAVEAVFTRPRAVARGVDEGIITDDEQGADERRGSGGARFPTAPRS